MSKGSLIVLEGAGDGVGKSTQLCFLKDRLSKEGYSFMSGHFPAYGTFHGKLVEEYLAGRLGTLSREDAYFVSTLYGVDRACAMRSEGYLDYYNNEGLIIFDRYTTSTLIYQTVNMNDNEKRSFIDYITDLEYNKQGVIVPDEVLFLDASIELMDKLREERARKTGEAPDIYESNNDILKKISYNSKFVADYLGWTLISCEDNGKFRTIEDIHSDVYNNVKKLIKKRNR